jgi:hypothetical protein
MVIDEFRELNKETSKRLVESAGRERESRERGKKRKR